MEDQEKGRADVPSEQCCREKYWKELRAYEKIERMCEEVRVLQKRYDRMYVKLERLENLFKNHNHADGKVVADVKTNQPEQYLSAHRLESEIKGEVRF